MNLKVDETPLGLDYFVGATYAHLLTRKQLLMLLDAFQCAGYKKAGCYAMHIL